ncbi:MAG TPA: hypothetical protein VJW77_04230, partial [Terriglobia bacterium]|nr:hypothetical protein [Terriglobia bacterium]
PVRSEIQIGGIMASVNSIIPEKLIALAKEKGACQEAIEWLQEKPRRFVDLAKKESWAHWTVERLLSAPAQKAYFKAIAPAQKAYFKAITPAQKAYFKAITTAWKAYREATATALADLLEKELPKYFQQ